MTDAELKFKSPCSASVFHPPFELASQNLRVSVDGGHQAETHCSADGLCNSALIDWSQTGLIPVLDTAQRGHILGHDREILLSRHVSYYPNLLPGTMERRME